MQRAPSAPSPSAAPAEPSSDYDFEDESIAGELSRAEGAYMNDEVATTSSRSSKKDAAQKAAFPLDEPGPVIVRPTFSDPRLPAVSAGGLDYVWDAPLPANVPSTGQDVRVPLGTVTWPVETFYEATPSLMKTAFLSAEATNKGRQPILRGPMSIFSGGDFVAEGELETTGPGGTIRLPLGADEDLRFEYTVVPATVTEGLIKKDEITTYSVTIEVGNYKKRPVRLVLFDQIPKTNNQDIEVKLLGATPPTASEPDGNGRLEWQVDLPAGKTQKITFQYRVRRPADFRLYQR